MTAQRTVFINATFSLIVTGSTHSLRVDSLPTMGTLSIYRLAYSCPSSREPQLALYFHNHVSSPRMPPTSIDPSNSRPFERYQYPFALDPHSLPRERPTIYSSVASLANSQLVLRPRVRPPGSCPPSCGPFVLRRWDGRLLSSLFSKHQLPIRAG